MACEVRGYLVKLLPPDSEFSPKRLTKPCLPVLLFRTGQLLVDPSHAELAESLGASTQPASTTYDVAMVGAAPGRACRGGLGVAAGAPGTPDSRAADAIEGLSRQQRLGPSLHRRRFRPRGLCRGAPPPLPAALSASPSG